MTPPTHWSEAVAIGVLITVISAVIVWALRRLATLRPPTNGNGNGKDARAAAEAFRADFARALVQNQDWHAAMNRLIQLDQESRAAGERIQHLERQMSLHAEEAEDRNIRLHKLHLRVVRLEEGVGA